MCYRSVTEDISLLWSFGEIVVRMIYKHSVPLGLHKPSSFIPATGTPHKLSVADGFNRSRLELSVSLQRYLDPNVR